MSIKRLPNDLGFYLPGTLPGSAQVSEEDGQERGTDMSSAVYVLVQGRRCGIVDTGMGIGVFRTLTQALHRLRVFPEWVLLTHDHYDHVANAGWFRDEMGVPIHCHEGDLPLIEQPLRVFDEDYMLRTHGVSLRQSFLEMNRSEDYYQEYIDRVLRDRFYPVRIDATSEDGDILEVGDLEVEILHTPGHSPGSLSVYIPRFGTLLAGDTPLWYGPGRPSPLGDFRAWVDSMERLLLLDTEFIGWGHSAPTLGRSRCRRFMNNTLRRAREIEDAIVEEIHHDPQTVDELAELIYGDNVRVLDEQREIGEDSVHSLLGGLRREGRAATVVGGDGVIRWCSGDDCEPLEG